MIEDLSSKNLLSMGCWEKSSIMLWLEGLSGGVLCGRLFINCVSRAREGWTQDTHETKAKTPLNSTGT